MYNNGKRRERLNDPIGCPAKTQTDAPKKKIGGKHGICMAC